ncbi:MAG TPA: hypothetical protein DDW90_00240 [Cyanobacteria bacterium UBA9971]|nr:hypothetical protein [Cyanobacteria bacterium UBA9971]
MKKLSYIVILATALIFAGSQIVNSAGQPCPVNKPCPTTTTPCPCQKMAKPCPVKSKIKTKPCPVTKKVKAAPCPCEKKH